MDKFFNIEQINPNLSLLNERFEEIHKEFKENVNDLLFMNFGGDAGYYMRDDVVYKGWKVAPLYGNYKDISHVNGNLQKYENMIQIDGELVKVLPNICKLPILTQTLIESGINKRVGISVVYPEKEISWHTDIDPEKPDLAIVRGLFGLDIAEEEGKESFIYLKNKEGVDQKVTFKNNEFVFFWGRTKHKVENNLSQPRYMICFDQIISRDYLLSLGN